MNSETAVQGGSTNGDAPIRPLEPGRPDVMPNPPAKGIDVPSKEGERPLERDDGSLEEDVGDVEINLGGER